MLASGDKVSSFRLEENSLLNNAFGDADNV